MIQHGFRERGTGKIMDVRRIDLVLLRYTEYPSAAPDLCSHEDLLGDRSVSVIPEMDILAGCNCPTEHHNRRGTSDSRWMKITVAASGSSLSFQCRTKPEGGESTCTNGNGVDSDVKSLTRVVPREGGDEGQGSRF
jgi:hypothetical protein